MAFKERIKKVGKSIKNFWKEHWPEVIAIGGGIALTGAACYGMYKSEKNKMDNFQQYLEDTHEDRKNEAINSIIDKTSWNKDWDELGTNFEHLTHQPWGDITADDDQYVDPFEGNCFIIAGPNSLYNDSPDTLEFYMLDNEGYYHRMPDEVRSA